MTVQNQTWRVGRKVGRTVYGEGEGFLIGSFDSREAACLASYAPALRSALAGMIIGRDRGDDSLHVDERLMLERLDAELLDARVKDAYERADRASFAAREAQVDADVAELAAKKE